MKYIKRKPDRQITVEINKSDDVMGIGFIKNGFQTSYVVLDKELFTMLVDSLSDCEQQLEEWINNA